MHDRITFMCQKETARKGRHTPSSSVSALSLSFLGPDGLPPSNKPTPVSVVLAWVLGFFTFS